MLEPYILLIVALVLLLCRELKFKVAYPVFVKERAVTDIIIETIGTATK